MRTSFTLEKVCCCGHPTIFLSFIQCRSYEYLANEFLKSFLVIKVALILGIFLIYAVNSFSLQFLLANKFGY